MKFRRLSEDAVLQAGTGIAVLAYAILNVLLLPTVLELTGSESAIGKIVAILLSAVGLFALIRVSVTQLLKVWARPVLGRWAYESSAGNFALLHFDVEGSTLHYRVDVYPELADILAALDGDPAAQRKCVAHASAKALSYRDGLINLIYRIERTSGGYAPREGVLTLELMPGERSMKGHWHSNVEEGERRGTLDVYREEEFRALHPACPALAAPVASNPTPALEKGGARRRRRRR